MLISLLIPLIKAASFSSDFIFHGDSTATDTWTGQRYLHQVYSEDLHGAYRRVRDLAWINQPARIIYHRDDRHLFLLPTPIGFSLRDQGIRPPRALAARLILQIMSLHLYDLYGYFNPAVIYLEEDWNSLPRWTRLSSIAGSKLQDWRLLAEVLNNLYPRTEALQPLLVRLSRGNVWIESIMEEPFFAQVDWGKLWKQIN